MPYLMFKDGTYFQGQAFGFWSKEEDVCIGEVVFNTSMSGYQEMITDLSYAGQMLVLTHPQIGNYGWHNEDNEADKILLQALIVRELSEGEGSLHSDNSLEAFCIRHHIRGLKAVDTRALTRHIRCHGTLTGVLVEDLETGHNYWAEKEKKNPEEVKNKNPKLYVNPLAGISLEADENPWVYAATVRETYEIPGSGPLLAVLDFGAKRNILRELHKRGFRLKVYPAWASAEEVLEYKPQGLVLSNGPGDPSGLPRIIETVRALYPQLPTLGICLGHQMLALAAGGTTYKLPFGHRGGNHPVQDIRTGKTTMTSQNHGYAVDEDSLKDTGFEITMRNLNDGTVEGMEHRNYPVFSVQYHPEGAPGPEENAYIFEQFFAKLEA